MEVYKRFSPSILSAFSIVMMIVVWLTFAPIQAGGMASYIVIIGKSMEPKFHIGDLVTVHKEPLYKVGDAIVYRNLDLNSFVFHRILSEQLGRYALKGDNNAWVDTYQPARKEILGKLWLHIPRGGVAIQKIRKPFNMALIAAILGAIFASSLFRNKTKGSKHMNNRSFREWFVSVQQKTRNWFVQVSNSEQQREPLSTLGRMLEGLFLLLGVISLSSLILGIISFSRPVSRISQGDISYEHLGVFSYSSSAPQGVYDLNVLKSGDPIFTHLTCSADVNFQYTLVAPQPENISGTYQLTAIIREQVSGWQRNVPLQETSSFTGATFGTSAKLDLCKMESLTQSLEQDTDFHPGYYTLLITPNIKLNGEISGRAFDSTFDSGLNFQYDRVHFFLVRDEAKGSSLNLTETGIIHEEHMEANTIILFGKEIAVSMLRLLALIGLIISLAGLVVLGLRLQNLSHSDQEKFFQLKYDSLMVDIQNADSLVPSNAIDVTNMDALAKLAERFNAMILHAKEGSMNVYYVQGSGITYRFVMNGDIAGIILPAYDMPSQGGGS